MIKLSYFCSCCVVLLSPFSPTLEAVVDACSCSALWESCTQRRSVWYVWWRFSDLLQSEHFSTTIILPASWLASFRWWWLVGGMTEGELGRSSSQWRFLHGRVSNRKCPCWMRSLSTRESQLQSLRVHIWRVELTGRLHIGLFSLVLSSLRLHWSGQCILPCFCLLSSTLHKMGRKSLKIPLENQASVNLFEHIRRSDWSRSSYVIKWNQLS